MRELNTVVKRDSQATGGGRLLVALVMTYVLIYGIFYPRTFSILDEQGYLSYALALTRGTAYADVAGVYAARSVERDGHLVPSMGIGTSVLLAPAVALNWKLSFALIGLVHLLGVAACAGALRKTRLPVWYAALYLLHPVAALFSRTAMSDVPAMTLMMLGVFAYLPPRSSPFRAGLAWGLMPSFRFAQLAAVAAVAAAVAIRDGWRSCRRRRLDFRRTVSLALGLLPGMALLAAVNMVLYGGFSDMPVAWPLSVEYLPSNLPRYLVSQNVVYPLGLLIACFYRFRGRLECSLVAVAMLLLYSCFRHLYEGFGLLGSMIIGDRFFAPLFAFIVLPYAAVLERLLQRSGRWRRTLQTAALGGLVLIYGGASFAHDRRLADIETVQRKIYELTDEASLILCNGQAGQFFFDGLGHRRIVLPWQLGTTERAATMLAAAIPNLYLVTLKRLDRAPDSEGEESMLRFASQMFQLEPLGEIVAGPDRLSIFRVVAARNRS